MILLDNKINLTKKDYVHKTTDKLLIEELKKFEEKKIPIRIEITATKEMFSLTIIDENQNRVVKESSICEIAKKRATTKEEIKSQINRLGSTPFNIKEIKINLEENLFIPVSKINEIRKKAITELTEKREK